MNDIENLQYQIKKLKQTINNIQDENTYLKSQLKKCETKPSCQCSIDYEVEYPKLQEQLTNAKKVIKYLNGLI